MRTSHTVVAGIAAAMAAAVSLTGCSGNKTSAPASSSKSGSAAGAPSSAPSSTAPGPDYGGLLIKASDIDAPEPFTAGPQVQNPNGQLGIATTFSTQDGGHVIKDTIQVLADPGAATNALNAAKTAQGGIIKNPTTDPASVGAGSTMLSGNAPDNSKGVAVLLFTEGKGFVTLEFDGPVDTLPPLDFVNGVGGKQDAAVKKGLGG